MLYIEKGEKSDLPLKHQKANNICAHIYDQLVEIFESRDYKAMHVGEYKVDHSQHILLKEIENNEIHILDWLKKNNLDKELTDLLVKRLTVSIVEDFVHFMYESLSSAKKGKMSVAYALLRKPFTDELLILEQLLFDPDDFIQRFYYEGNPSQYDPSDKSIDKRIVIRNALTKIIPNAFYTEDLIYDLRYNKSTGYGINKMTNHALHIVTRDKNYVTKDQNLNFIFSTKANLKEYWKHYYSFVPILLMYAVSVIDSIVFKYLPNRKTDFGRFYKEFIRTLGFLFLSEEIKKTDTRRLKNIFNYISNNIKFYCSNCSKTVLLNKLEFEFFFVNGYFSCSTCKARLLNKYSDLRIFKEFSQLASRE